MNIFRRIVRTFRRKNGPRDTPPVIDHVLDSGGSGEWRKRKLTEAAQKYGRPFKCAGDEMPREVVHHGRIITVAERTPTCNRD